MNYYSDYISHHGILGQKWGVRRYQNKDGSLTTLGKKRASEGAAGRHALLNEGEAKARNARIGGKIKGAVAEVASPVVGTVGGAAAGSSIGPVGAVGGAAAGFVAGKISGKVAKEVIIELSKEKANAISNEYLLLANEIAKEYSNVKVKDIPKESNQPYSEKQKL